MRRLVERVMYLLGLVLWFAGRAWRALPSDHEEVCWNTQRGVRCDCPGVNGNR